MRRSARRVIRLKIGNKKWIEMEKNGRRFKKIGEPASGGEELHFGGSQNGKWNSPADESPLYSNPERERESI